MQGFLNDCHQIELLAGEIYGTLAAGTGYADEVRELFQRLAADELDHSRQIDLALHVPEDLAGAVSRIAGAQVGAMLKRVTQMLKGVTRSRLSEEEALRLALEMEQKFVKIHLDNAVHFKDPRVIALFQSLARSDEAHLDTLRDYLTRRWHREKADP
jgi:rubrerythrin